MVYAVVISIVGVLLGVVTFMKGGGFMGDLGGGLLLVAGVSMLVARLKGGVKFLDVKCPSCGDSGTYDQDSFVDGNTRPCEHCGTYLWDESGQVIVVPSGTVHAKPVFEAPLTLPVDVHDCVVCGQDASFKIPIEGPTSKWGVAATKYITREIELPVCGEHQDNENAALASAVYTEGGVDGFALKVRNLDLSERLRGR
jgi:ribosomal protein S27E